MMVIFSLSDEGEKLLQSAFWPFFYLNECKFPSLVFKILAGYVFQDLTQNTIVAKHRSDEPLSDVRFFIFCSPGSVQIACGPSNTDKEQTDPDDI